MHTIALSSVLMSGKLAKNRTREHGVLIGIMEVLHHYKFVPGNK